MAFWFFMCLSNEGHIRVATLRNHMWQNNAILKAYYPETQLPEWQALERGNRLLRLLSYFLMLLVCSAFAAMWGMGDVEQLTLRRDLCHQNCLLATFPDTQACRVRDDLAVIQYEGNTYSRFFNYTLPDPAIVVDSQTRVRVNSTAHNENSGLTPAVASSASTSLSRRFAIEAEDFARCLGYVEQEPLAYDACSRGRRRLVDGRCEKLVVCFSGCKVSEQLWTDYLSGLEATSLAAAANTTSTAAGGTFKCKDGRRFQRGSDGVAVQISDGRRLETDGDHEDVDDSASETPDVASDVERQESEDAREGDAEATTSRALLFTSASAEQAVPSALSSTAGSGNEMTMISAADTARELARSAAKKGARKDGRAQWLQNMVLSWLLKITYEDESQLVSDRSLRSSGPPGGRSFSASPEDSSRPRDPFANRPQVLRAPGGYSAGGTLSSRDDDPDVLDRYLLSASSDTDTRPVCNTVLDAQKSLLCLPYTPGQYENSYQLIGTFCFGDAAAGNGWCISVGGILLAICIANILQFLFENVYLYLSVLDESYDFQEAYRKCFGQFGVIFLHAVLLVCTVGPFHQASRMDKIEQVVVTFLLVFALDQAKNLLVQPVIWWLVIRRCGRVQPGIQEYNEEYLLQWELQESLLDEMQRRTREFLEKRAVLVFIIGLVGFYAVFLMLSIVISDCWKISDEPSECTTSLCPGLSERGRLSLYYSFTYLDFCIMVIFVAEILLKLFGYGTSFILDPWNFFDSLIVLVSFICWFLFLGSTVGTTGLGLLRLLRLVRVMVMMSASRRKLKKVTKTLQAPDGTKSHVEKVLDLLEKLQNLKIPPQMQQDLEWTVDMILENKLYKVSVDEPGEQEEGEKNDASMAAWIQQLGDGTGSGNLSAGLGTAPNGTGANGDGANGGLAGDNVRGTYVAQSGVRGSFANRGSTVARVRGSYTRGSYT